jgi:hypothetical protein
LAYVALLLIMRSAALEEAADALPQLYINSRRT